MKLDDFLKKLISFLFPVLFFLAPLFFTPVNSELFEFNKMILVYGFTILIVGAWTGRMICQRRIIFKRTFLDIPLTLFLTSQIISTFLSIDRHTSLFGYYSRFNGGLLSAISYLLLYWAFVSNCENKDVYKVIKVSLVSALIVSIYGILEHFGHSFSCLMFEGNFGVSCWVQKVQERAFATLGQPNWLAAYLAVLIPLSLVISNPSNDEGEKSSKASPTLSVWISHFVRNDLVNYILNVLFFSCLLFTQSRSGFLGFVVSAVVFWLLVLNQNKENPKTLLRQFLILNTCYLILIFVFGSPFPQINKYLYYKSFTSRVSTHNPPPQPDSQLTTHSQPLPQLSEDGGISQSSDIRKIVWKGAIDIFKHYPLFGSGVETFAYAYYQFRPMEHNLLTEWDFLYNKAHNEYLNFLATTGALGTITYLGFIISFIFFSSRIISNYIRINPNINEFGKIRDGIRMNSGEKSGETLTDSRILILSLFAGWASLLITNFFGFSVVVTSLYFFLIPAFIITLNSQLSTPNSPLPTSHSRPTSHLSPPLLLLVPLILTSYFLILVLNLWRADYHYALGEKLSNKGEYADAYQQLYKATNLSPHEPVILDKFSSTTASLALLSNASEKNASSTAELSSLALAYSDKAYQISPKNLNIIKTRVRVFYTLSVIKPEALDKAIETMLEAIKLAPTDPKLVYNLGLLYSKKGDGRLAVETIEKSIAMKPNYIDARNALAVLFEDAGEKQKALEQLQILIRLSPDNAPEFQKRIDKL